MPRIEPQKPDQTFNRSRERQREVLAYLKEHGPQPYDVLSVNFDPNRTAEIQAVLRELIQWKFIDKGTDSHMTISITAAGIARLGLKDIWNVYGLTRISAGSERLDRMSKANDLHVEANLEVIREYLIGQFKGFEVTDRPDRPSSHTFTVTKSADERYQVKVSWPQLSDNSNTPERTKQRLVTDDVAGRMKGKSQGEYFSWGKY